MTENVVGKSDWILIETLYRFEGSETKLHKRESSREGGESRLAMRTAAKQIPQSRSRNSTKLRLGRERTLKTTQEVR